MNKNSTKLYITDTPAQSIPASGSVPVGNTELFFGSESSAIYVFDLGGDGFPRNKRLFGLAERGIPDGLHIDDNGRVWTGEADGIVVRSEEGKVLGMVNALAVEAVDVVDSGKQPLQNFGLAGDRIIVLAFTKIYQVRLSKAIVTQMT